MLVLQRLIAFNVRRGPHAHGDVQLNNDYYRDAEPKRNSNGIVPIGHMEYAKVIEHLLRNKGPNHVDDEAQR